MATIKGLFHDLIKPLFNCQCYAFCYDQLYYNQRYYKLMRCGKDCIVTPADQRWECMQEHVRMLCRIYNGPHTTIRVRDSKGALSMVANGKRKWKWSVYLEKCRGLFEGFIAERTQDKFMKGVKSEKNSNVLCFNLHTFIYCYFC